MFQDEVYDGGRGPNTTYPYINFEKAFDDMTNYLSIDMKDMYVSKPESYDSIEQTPEIVDEVNVSSMQSSSVSTCSELLSKIPDIENDIVFELKIYTNTPQIYNKGGVTQLEYLLKNM